MEGTLSGGKKWASGTITLNGSLTVKTFKYYNSYGEITTRNSNAYLELPKLEFKPSLIVASSDVRSNHKQAIFNVTMLSSGITYNMYCTHNNSEGFGYAPMFAILDNNTPVVPLWNNSDMKYPPYIFTWYAYE